MATSDRGLGSPNMSEQEKDKIHSMGGQASHSGGRNASASKSNSSSGTITNKSGGGGLDKDAQRRGGQNSHRS